ncbi:ceramidase domain-containing protein [Ensifer adhaerens]|uniref:ceramidase domain-containing protein n=1 Tax=Ensifer adhaerens TaxID=106592 RepID=UPI000CF190EC|nr:ceramidase domain-containing protein [Ensifer adhaerens]
MTNGAKSNEFKGFSGIVRALPAGVLRGGAGEAARKATSEYRRAEPFNALTNLGFLMAAAAIFVSQRRAGRTDKQLLVLALLTASVGIGSFLFHTLANRWSLADIVPIAVVIYSFFFVALTRLLRLSATVAGLLTATLLVLSPVLETVAKPLLGGSATYAPGLIATFGVAVAVPLTGRGSMPRLLVAAGTIFSAALVFRILDAPLCGSWSVGTHFIWHLLNAVALGLARGHTGRR